MHFSGGINRPPYETADGYLQTTEGCSHNTLSHIPQHFAMTVAAANNARITAPSYETNVGHFCPGKWLQDEIEHAIIH